MNKTNKVEKLKILFFDIENSPNIGYTWGKYEQNVTEFIEESHLLCFAWKWYGEKKTYVKSLRDYKSYKNNLKDDTLLVKDLHYIMDSADILVAHNGASFDIKMANMYFVRHGLLPISEKKVIDTKRWAKNKFRFNSNKLDDLGIYFGLGRKIKTDFSLWLGCMSGDNKSWGLMEKYNKQDVILLEKVYEKLKPFCKHPIVTTTLTGCRVCGNNDLEYRGWSYLDSGKSRKRKMRCKKCGRWGLGDCEKVTSLEVTIKE